MKKIFFALGLLFINSAHAAVRPIVNPVTGRMDFITDLSTLTLPGGSTSYLQNSELLQQASAYILTSTVAGNSYVGDRLSVGASSPSSKFDLNGGSITVRGTNGGLVVLGGNVGIGTAGPATPIDIHTANGPILTMTRYAAGGSAASMSGRKASGSQASPTTVANGDQIFNYQFLGYDGTSYLRRATISTVVSGGVGTGVVPMDIQFQTGSNANPSTKMTITSSGTIDMTSGPVTNVKSLSFSNGDTQGNAATGLVCSSYPLTALSTITCGPFPGSNYLRVIFYSSRTTIAASPAVYFNNENDSGKINTFRTTSGGNSNSVAGSSVALWTPSQSLNFAYNFTMDIFNSSVSAKTGSFTGFQDQPNPIGVPTTGHFSWRAFNSTNAIHTISIFPNQGGQTGTNPVSNVLFSSATFVEVYTSPKQAGFPQ